MDAIAHIRSISKEVIQTIQLAAQEIKATESADSLPALIRTLRHLAVTLADINCFDHEMARFKRNMIAGIEEFICGSEEYIRHSKNEKSENHFQKSQQRIQLAIHYMDKHTRKVTRNVGIGKHFIYNRGDRSV